MNIMKLMVASSKETTRENFCNKLVGAGVVVDTPIGKVEGAKRTFYMFTQTKAEQDLEFEMNMDLFDQVKKPVWFGVVDSKSVAYFNLEDIPKGLETEEGSLTYLYPTRPA